MDTFREYSKMRFMREDMSRFRVGEQTPNERIKAYRFAQEEVEIPDDPENGDWTTKLLRYAELSEQQEESRKHNNPISPENIKEKRLLHALLDRYLYRTYMEHRRSILKSSLGQPVRPQDHGKDSHVFYYGQFEDFVSNPEVPRYVTKYSVPEREVAPEHIEYLAHTYKLLRALMNENIPRAWFVLGEYRYNLPKTSLGKFDTKFRAITIQREVRGKTFEQMTLQEKQRPKVQAALKVALDNYLATRTTVEKACEHLGVREENFTLSLDMGAASPNGDERVFNPMTYSSPNVMYDEQKEKVFFIDMGWGTWTPDKEKVFDYIINRTQK